MTRVQASEFDQFLLKFDTLTIEVIDSRKRVEKVIERMQNNVRCSTKECSEKVSKK
jgi:hypothetical protein